MHFLSRFFELPAKLLLAFICLAAFTEADETPWDVAENERQAQLAARFQQTLDDWVAITDPQNLDRGGSIQVAVNLAQGKNLEWARERLRRINREPSGAMFWMYPMVLVMKAGAENLTADDWAGIREAWRTYFPFRGDTENHWLMYYSSLFLASETWPELGPEGWYNGKSSAENRAEAKDYILEWIRITTSYGQGEYDSPNYIDSFTSPLALLARWAEDTELRQLANMMLEYILCDFAAENLGGIYGGAHSRVYPKHVMQPALGASTALAWLLFGQGDYQRSGLTALVALSEYRPPAIIHRIANDRSSPYEHRELKRTRWRMRHAGPNAFEVGGNKTIPVYKYSYVTRDYLIGSSQGGLLQPIQQQTWSLVWNEEHPKGVSNTFFALHPFHSPLEGTMYFSAEWDIVTDLIARSKVDYDSPDKLEGGSPFEQVFQHKSAIIGLYDIPEGTDFPHITTFFSKDLDSRATDDSGWIFCRGGPCFIAYRPFAPGVWRTSDWTGLLEGGAGAWISARWEEWGAGHDLYVSEHLKNGYIVQVAAASEFTSFDEFKTAVRALPVEISLQPTSKVRFTTLDATVLEATFGEVPKVNGKTMDYPSWKLFDGPFLTAERESQQLLIKHGEESRHLDFVSGTTTSTTGHTQ